MKSRKLWLWGILISFTALQVGRSENYIIEGVQSSKINYRLTQSLVPAGKTRDLKMRFVVPSSFHSITYSQEVDDFHLSATPEPSNRKEHLDLRGNKIIELIWKKAENRVEAVLDMRARTRTHLASIESNAPFPVEKFPKEFDDYLAPTAQVQSNHAAIIDTVRHLVENAGNQYDAVQHILSWIVDNVRYVTPPAQYDAVFTFEKGRGNCQNFSHLAAAMMRIVGIPVRIVNGITLNQPFTTRSTEGEFTFKMGQGRHSWIEVYFPDLNWVPFDPQQTELFVSNRFLRIEVGVDNNETVNDGMVRFRQHKSVQGRPQFREVIEAEFPEDEVNLSLTKQKYGPRSMLLSPRVTSLLTPVIVTPPPPPVVVPVIPVEQLKLDKAWLFGNLQFPRQQSFWETRGEEHVAGSEDIVLKKNFLVETAEYVTTKMTQYAQVFILEKPFKLIKLGLALHKFGGSGQLWLELKTDINGKPGEVLAASSIKDLGDLPFGPGYDWVDFDFSKEAPKLKPGRYWIALGFTGSPIINWFYTYGKPVGPVDGTRYKSVYSENWSGAMAYEFNYRVAGWTNR
ncbi:transglutaminase domain-containing protein [bacterium]|nr:transglutaminase domain-containing protein [bacterium]